MNKEDKKYRIQREKTSSLIGELVRGIRDIKMLYAKESFVEEIDENIEKLIYADIYSGLRWVNYNFKRSLCIKNEYKQDEIELAESEIIQSIGEIKYNVSQMNKMIEILKR